MIVRSSAIWVPPGADVVRATLDAMRQLVRRRGKLTRDVAAGLLEEWGSRRFAELLGPWLEERWIFEPDPYGVELVRGSDLLLERIERNGRVAGDCDDAATLAASLALSAGMSARWVVLSWGPAGEDHVYAEVAGPAGRWYIIDPWAPDGRDIAPPVSEMIVYPEA